MNDTELRLSAWRDGSTQAERLAAACLRLSGFAEIDPQAPLGGPDDKKDLLCAKGGLKWVGAVYFPIGPVTFTKIRNKFRHDLQGVTHGYDGIAFVTNQTLTPSERRKLQSIASTARKEVEIFHLERLRALLDSAPGYGVRIQFLRVPMTIEEQLSWVSDSDSQVAQEVASNTRELRTMRAILERMSAGQEHIRRTIATLTVPNGPITPDLVSSSNFQQSYSQELVTADLNISLMMLFHRLTCFDLPTRQIGRFRERDVWIGPPGAAAARLRPPSSSEVTGLVESLCAEWRRGFLRYRTVPSNERREAIAIFHARLLGIHPFLDGNGRTARAILMQQCLDLFGNADMSLLDKGQTYYAALAAADAGSPQQLASLLAPVVEDPG